MADNRRDCVLCRRAVNNRRRFEITRALFEEHPAIGQYIIDAIAPENELQYNGQEYLCRPCWQRAERAAQENQNRRPHECVLQLAEYSRVANTAARCLFPDCRRGNLHRITENLQISFLMDFNLYIPPTARICTHHMEANDWDQVIDNPNLLHDFNAEHVIHMMTLMKTVALRGAILDFENLDEMEPHEIRIRLGVTREQFENLKEQIPSLANVARPNTTLACYLMKLRSGEANERLAGFFKLSRRTFERNLNSARDCLTREFVPRHLGYDHLTRRDVADRNLLIPNAIFGGNEAERKPIVICDATYIYIQKSSNYLFQRMTYSLHKFTNLLKPFLMVCCDGHIIDAFGPYAATQSDATIMKNMLGDEENVLPWFFEMGDVFILDRGFRDVVEDLQAHGYETHLPQSVNRGEEQLSTEQANKSRLVTICRWVVEVINGRFKRDFRLFRQDFFNRALPHMMEDFRIAAALLNATRTPFQDSPHAQAIVEIINERINERNNLAAYVLENNINRRRAAFESIIVNDADFADFPVLDEENLILFALGTYQIKLARSYYAEHVRRGMYTIEIFRDPNIAGIGDYGIIVGDAWLLRCKIQSRHARAKTYYCYILVDKEKNGRDALNNYYCTCLSGKRTLACCAHVMSVVWYLSWARNQEGEIPLPADFLNDVIVDEEQ